MVAASPRSSAPPPPSPRVTLTLNTDSVEINHATNNNNDGSIRGIPGVWGKGELLYKWVVRTGVSYDPVSPETTTLMPLTGVPAGTYLLMVRSENRRKTGSEVFVINSINTMEITTITITDATNGMLDGSIQVNIDHGTLPYKYIWNEKESNAIIYDFTTNTLIDVPAGTYTLTVSDNSNPVQSISKDIIIQNVGVELNTELYTASNTANTVIITLLGDNPMQVDGERAEYVEPGYNASENVNGVWTNIKDQLVIEWSTMPQTSPGRDILIYSYTNTSTTWFKKRIVYFG